MTGDLKDFYLGTHMTEKEYIRVPIAVILQEIIELYNLHELIVYGFVYV